jgi:DNA-binding response OmpR family regulator
LLHRKPRRSRPGVFRQYTTDLGEEGADLGKLYDYDIILLDLNLPDMSGYEVLRSLRVSKVKTPILILSGLAGMEDIAAAISVQRSASKSSFSDEELERATHLGRHAEK